MCSLPPTFWLGLQRGEESGPVAGQDLNGAALEEGPGCHLRTWVRLPEQMPPPNGFSVQDPTEDRVDMDLGQ